MEISLVELYRNIGNIKRKFKQKNIVGQKLIELIEMLGKTPRNNKISNNMHIKAILLKKTIYV